MTSQVYVWNINYHADTRDIENFFRRFRVHHIQLRQGFAIVQLDSPRAATNAVNELNGLQLLGRSVRVDYARKRPYVDEYRGSSRRRTRSRSPRRHSRSRSPRRHFRSRSPRRPHSTSNGGLSSSSVSKTSAAQIPTTFYGAASAKELLEHSTVIFDPTQMIVDLSMYKTPQRAAIYFPPEFGAPMVASVLEAYFRIHPVERDFGDGRVLLNQAPTPEQVHETANHKLFASFDPPLQIMEEKYDKVRRKHCGRHPVILVDFSQPTETTRKLWRRSKKLAVANAKQRLREFNTITEWRKPGDVNMSTIFHTSLSRLAELLYEHFELDVFVFIIGYDKPYTCSLENYMDVNGLYTFYRHIIAHLLSCEAVKIALFFGIDPLADLRSSSLKECSYPCNVGYGRYIGVSKEALQAFLNCHSINPTETVLELFAEECGGYPMTYTSSRGSEVAYTLFSTSDVVRLVNRYHCLGAPTRDDEVARQVRRAIKAEAEESCSKSLVLSAFDGFIDGKSDIFNTLTDLLMGEPIEFPLVMNYELGKLRNLKSAADSTQQPSWNAFALFFTQYLQYGYLVKHPLSDHHFILPNQKAKRFFASKIADFYVEKWDISNGGALEVSQKLVNLFRVEKDFAQYRKDDLKRAMEHWLKSIPFTKIMATSFDNIQRFTYSGENIIHTLVSALMSIHVSRLGSEVEWYRPWWAFEEQADMAKGEEKLRQGRIPLVGKHHIKCIGMCLQLKWANKKFLNEAMEECLRYGFYFVRFPQEGVEAVVFTVVNVNDDKTVQVETQTRSIAELKREFQGEPVNGAEGVKAEVDTFGHMANDS